jgi:pimeloyl-ACP methyl ester carboxylesterase
VLVPRGANFRLSELDADIEVEPVTLIAEDSGYSRGVLYRRRGSSPKVGVHLMHPRTDQSQNYSIVPLVRAGYAVLGRAGRWVNNDVATVHETLALDVAAGVRLLRERGCEQVVLLGNSGGGTLAAFYQWQATTEAGSRLPSTPGGHDTGLRSADLPPADGIVLIGAHLGEGASLLKWIDPSVTDESDPFAADPALDMYDVRNGFRPLPSASSYTPEFLTRYRAAQRERVARLDELARARLADARAAARDAAGAGDSARMSLERRAAHPGHLVIHRTMADPAFVDLSLEPDDRRISSYNSGLRPDLQNYGTGVAPFLTPEAWLSTWSGLSTRAYTPDCLREVTEPTLVVHYAGDVITHLGEAESLYRASAAADKHFVTVRGADHYGFVINQDGSGGPRTTEGTEAVTTWMRDRFPLSTTDTTVASSAAPSRVGPAS